MAILSRYNINRFMYPLCHCTNITNEQKERILQYACNTQEHENEYNDFTGIVSYQAIDGTIIAKLKTRSYYAIKGEYELIEYAEDVIKNYIYKHVSSHVIIKEFWYNFELFRKNELVEGFDVLRKYVDERIIKKLREKAYFCKHYGHYSGYDYEISGYNDKDAEPGSEVLTINLHRDYIYYDDKFNEILNFEHHYNKNEIKIIEIDPTLK